LNLDETKKQRLMDSVKRLKQAGNSHDEIISGLKDIGLTEKEITEITQKVFSEQKKVSVENNSIPVNDLKKENLINSSEEKPVKKGFLNKLFHKKEKIKAEEKNKAIGSSDKSVDSDVSFKTISENKKGVGEVSVKPVSFREVLPVRVSDFDKLIQRGGLKRGDTVLISGGCGTGKTTFGMQALYNGALNGEKGVYITLEESTEKIRENMVENFGWDLPSLERKGLLALIRVDPLKLARSVEALLVQKRGGLYIEEKQFDLSLQFNIPFKPDRVVFDSISALSIAFMENEQGFRQYIRSLFTTFESYGSLNFILGETEQIPGVYSRSGIEEFLADGVIVLYNLKMHNSRQKALEILKLRSSNHEKKIVPYKLTDSGIEIYGNEELFKEIN
jgi:KaiC/GvpD/RAD55 family RecA-like ATPase